MMKKRTYPAPNANGKQPLITSAPSAYGGLASKLREATSKYKKAMEQRKKEQDDVIKLWV